MPIDDTTAGLGLPKPNAANTLAYDVERLRAALDQVDTALLSRVLSSALATVATSGAYGDLSGRPTLGTAAAAATGDFATAAQGALAAAAVQSARQVLPGVGLSGGGDLSGDVTLLADFAEEADAVAGTNTTEVMNPLATRQMLDQRPPGIPVTSKTAAYALAATDKGYTVSTTNGGVTVPSSLPAGFAATIFNNSASDQTITQGVGLTLRMAGTTDTGNRTLAGYGVCTVLYLSTSLAVISGAGLS